MKIYRDGNFVVIDTGVHVYTAEITHLKNVSKTNTHLEWPHKKNLVRHIIVGNFERPDVNGLKSYPVFDYRNPFRKPVAMRYRKQYSFAIVNN